MIFQNLSDHESEEDLTLMRSRFIDAIANSLGSNLHGLSIQEQLVSLGYTEQRATFIANRISCNKVSKHHLSVLDFAHIFIQDLFKYDVLLTDEMAELPDFDKHGYNKEYVEKTSASVNEREVLCKNFGQNQK